MTGYPYGTPDDPYIVGYDSSGKVLRISPEEIEDIRNWSGTTTKEKSMATDEDTVALVKSMMDENAIGFLNQVYMASIQFYIDESYEIALEHGWWGPDKKNPEDCNIPEKLALIHSEISEALEEYRVHGMNPDKMIYVEEGKQKPEGFAVELADAMIRIFDLCGRYDIPIEKALRVKIGYNSTRPYRHGGKNC